MKRILIRLSALTAIVVLGLIAIAQAQRGEEEPSESGRPEKEKQQAAGQPPPENTTGRGGAAADPFSAARREDNDPLRYGSPARPQYAAASADGFSGGGGAGRYAAPPQPVGWQDSGQKMNPLRGPANGADVLGDGGAGGQFHEDLHAGQNTAGAGRESDVQFASQRNGNTPADPSHNSLAAPGYGAANHAAAAPGFDHHSHPAAQPNGGRNETALNSPHGLNSPQDLNAARNLNSPSGGFGAHAHQGAADGGQFAGEPDSNFRQQDSQFGQGANLGHGSNAGSSSGYSRFQTSSASHAALNSLASSSHVGGGANQRLIGGAGIPGDQRLEGAQAPALTIRKFAPAEIQIDKPALFEIHVRNTGEVPADNVEVVDVVPRGTQFIGSTPQTSPGPQGELIWKFDTLQPREEQVIKLELRPTEQGEIGSVATVRFSAQASTRTRCTCPDLRLDISTPRTVLIGEDAIMRLRLTNAGTGAAEGVIIGTQLPGNLSHPEGNVLEYDIGLLKPNAVRELELALKSEKPGPVALSISAAGEGAAQTSGEAKFNVIAPELDVVIQGPTRRYLERPAVYRVLLSNPGTAPAKNVELTAFLPKGMKFLKANNYGQFDRRNGMVVWELSELPPGQQETAEVHMLPMEQGSFRLEVEGRADRNVAVRREQPVRVEGVTAIRFQVVDVHDPITVGGETAYEIKIMNQGSKTATNIEVVAACPPELQPLGGDGPTHPRIEGNIIRFAPLARLAPRADASFLVKVRALRPGDLRMRVQLRSTELRAPVTKEESTRVFADE